MAKIVGHNSQADGTILKMIYFLHSMGLGCPYIAVAFLLFLLQSFSIFLTRDEKLWDFSQVHGIYPSSYPNLEWQNDNWYFQTSTSGAEPGKKKFVEGGG